MAELIYNNAKIVSMGYIYSKLNYKYHLHISYKEDIDFHSRSKAVDELTEELRNFMAT